MEEEYSTSAPKEEDLNNDLTYYSEKYFLKDMYSNEDELLSYIYSIIEAGTIKNYIDEVNREYLDYLKCKNREIQWLAIKSRFRAKSNLSQRL